MEREYGYKQALGSRGEDAAAAYLRQLGYRIVERNYTCPLGELDMITYRKGTLVFVEVRTNTPAYKGFAEASIGFRKQRKLRQVATYYLKQKGMLEQPCHFDVVIVLLDSQPGKQPLQIKLIENAF